MPHPIVLTIPADDTQLRDEIMRELKNHAEVHEASPTFGFNEVKLVIEIVSDAVSISCARRP